MQKPFVEHFCTRDFLTKRTARAGRAVRYINRLNQNLSPREIVNLLRTESRISLESGPRSLWSKRSESEALNLRDHCMRKAFEGLTILYVRLNGLRDFGGNLLTLLSRRLG